MYHERATVFRAFGYGLLLTIGSVVMCVWLHLHWEASLVCCSISVFTIKRMRDTYYRITKKFDFDESLTVDFHDIFEGPAAIQAVPLSLWRGMGGMGGKFANGAKGSFDAENDRRRHMSDVDEDEESLIRRNPKQMQTV
jgi:hypothetical protein